MNEPETLEELIGQTIGEASMLWDKDGVFESTKGVELMKRTVDKIRLLIPSGSKEGEK